MELDPKTQRAVQDLGDAINDAVAGSPRVSEAIEAMREIGFEPHLNLKLEIGLEALSLNPRQKTTEKFEFELTDEDLQTLSRMKIKF